MQPGLEQEGLGRNSEIRAGKGARSSAWRRSAQAPKTTAEPCLCRLL